MSLLGHEYRSLAARDRPLTDGDRPLTVRLFPRSTPSGTRSSAASTGPGKLMITSNDLDLISRADAEALTRGADAVPRPTLPSPVAPRPVPRRVGDVARRPR